MTTEQPAEPVVAPTATEQALVADISATRAELGQTIEEFVDKAQVGPRIKQAAASEVRGAGRAVLGTARRYQIQLAAAAAVVLAAAGVRTWRR